MKHPIIFTVTALGVATSTIPASAQTAQPAAVIAVGTAPQAETEWTLPANTEVAVAPVSEVSSKTLKEGDSFSFTVVHDVRVKNQIVIPRGARGEGKVVWRTGKGMFGKSAKMDLGFDWVEVDGQKIPLAGKYRQEGEGNTGATIGTVLAVGLVGGMFVTGKSAVVPQGMQLKAFTRDPLPVTPAHAMSYAAAPAPAPVTQTLAHVPAPTPAAVATSVTTTSDLAMGAPVAAASITPPSAAQSPATATLAAKPDSSIASAPVSIPPAVAPTVPPAILAVKSVPVVPLPSATVQTAVTQAVVAKSLPVPAAARQPTALYPAPVRRPVYVSPRAPLPETKPAPPRNEGVIIQ